MNITNEDATVHELRFVKRLGRWSDHHGLTRKELLKRYLLAMQKRVRWDGIDAARVRAFVVMELHLIGD